MTLKSETIRSQEWVPFVTQQVFIFIYTYKIREYLEEKKLTQYYYLIYSKGSETLYKFWVIIFVLIQNVQQIRLHFIILYI